MSRRMAGRTLTSTLGLGLAAGLFASDAGAGVPATPPPGPPLVRVQADGAGDGKAGDVGPGGAPGSEASASDLKAAIEAIKRRLSEQQAGRQTSGTGELAAELRSARETIGQLTESMNRLRAERDVMLEELKAVRNESAGRSSRIADLEREMAAVRAKAEQSLAALGEQVTTESGQRKALEGERQKLRQQLEGTLKEVDGLTALVEQARGERDKTEQALQEARSQATTEVSSRDEALSAAQQQLSELEKRLAERNAKQDELNRQMADLRQQLASVTDRAAASSREATQAKADFARTAKQLEAEQAAVAAARSEASDLAERVRQVRQEAEGRIQERTTALTGNLDKAEKQIAALEKELGELRSVAATSVAEVQNLGEQLLGSLQENKGLVAALGEVRASKEMLAKEVTAARNDAKVYADEATRLRAAGAGGGEAGQLRQALRDAQDEIEALTNELIARDQQIASAAAEGDVDALNKQVIVLKRQLKETDRPDEGKALPAELEATPAAAPAAGALMVATAPPTTTGLKTEPAGDGWVMARPEGIAFAPGSNQLADEAKGPLAAVADLIRRAKDDGRVRIVGHTDSYGDDAVNRELSLERAKAVARALVDGYGIRPDRIAAEGLGEADPIATNDTLEGRRTNRRVEVFVQEQ
ncbi:MAG: OmpA family protein [Geminicoccaceae bacterium]|nr:OmpA family protein [Geminicoccaceae bacterium]